MTEAFKTTRVGSVVMKILPDEIGDQECPLEGLDPKEGIRFVTFERRSTLSDYHDFGAPSDVVPWAKKNRYEVFPLYKYEHSQVAYSVRSFIGRAHHAEWDSGQTGFVLIKKSEFRGSKRRFEVAESWCKAVTTWCNGAYYGYVVEDENGEHLDSCWGFDDMAYCETEGLAVAKFHAKKLQDENFAESLNEHGMVL